MYPGSRRVQFDAQANAVDKVSRWFIVLEVGGWITGRIHVFAIPRSVADVGGVWCLAGFDTIAAYAVHTQMGMLTDER